MEYHQAEAVDTRTAEVIGEREGKGRETFQVVMLIMFVSA
jgi:hypothetical protein